MSKKQFRVEVEDIPKEEEPVGEAWKGRGFHHPAAKGMCEGRETQEG